MARHQLTGGGGIAFERSGVGDWVALLSKGFTQRHHQSTHFSFFRGPHRFFFSTTPVCLGLKDKNEKGVGGIAFQRSGVGDWVALLSKGFTQRHHQSTHFSVFFSSRAPSSHRRSVRRQTPEERRAVAIGRTRTRSLPSGDLSLTG